MGKILLLMTIIFSGCVRTDVTENSPNKTKTITVWNSDLKLHYDRITGEDDIESEATTQEGALEEIPEFYVEPALVDMLVEEAPTDSIDKLFRMDLVQKIKEDQNSSKKIVEAGVIDEKPQREREPKKIIWIVVLAGLASFGGYFTSIKKREAGNKGEER